MTKFDDLLYQEHRISRFPPEAKLNEAVGGGDLRETVT